MYFIAIIDTMTPSYWGLVFKSVFGGLLASLVSIALLYGILSCCNSHGNKK